MVVLLNPVCVLLSGILDVYKSDVSVYKSDVSVAVFDTGYVGVAELFGPAVEGNIGLTAEYPATRS